MENPFKVVRHFEASVAEFAGAPFAASVDTCSAALHLCCVRLGVKEVTLPSRTYPSAPCAVIHAGGTVQFEDAKWEGVYQFKPYPIIDGALRFRKGMYQGGFHCLSFHYKKRLAIGRGGMILCETHEDMDWFRQARFSGRHEQPLNQDDIEITGWNYYMDPERAARGLTLLANIPEDSPDLPTDLQHYPDLSKVAAYRV